MFIINALNMHTYQGQTIFLIACCCFDYTCLIVNILTEAEFEWRKKNRYICKTSASIFMSAGAIIRPRLIRREFIMRNALCFCLSSERNARKRSILWRSAVTSHLSSDKATSSFVYLRNATFVVEIISKCSSSQVS